MKVCTSGLGQDVRLLSKIVKAAGGDYEETLGRSVSVFVYGQHKTEHLKPAYAMKHRIPVVTSDWLLRSISVGKVQPLADYPLPANSLSIIERESRELAVNLSEHTGALETTKK